MPEKKKIKVAFVLRMLGFGGAERQTVELCQALDKNRFDVSVILFFHDEGYLEELKASGIRVKILATKENYKGVAFFRLARLFRTEKFDIIQLSLPIANFVGGLAARLFTRSIVVGSLRNSSPFSLRDPFCLMDLLAFHGFCNKVIANSYTGKKWAVEKYRLPEQKVTVIRNGKNFEKFTKVRRADELKRNLKIPEKNAVITTIGRITRQKGHKDLVEATDILVKRGVKEITVLIVGKPEESYAEIKSLIRLYALEEYVKLLGVRQDIPDILSISDVFVLPSLWEGLANALLEAMIAGVPVIATDIEANAEVIEHNKTGILIPKHNPTALADAVQMILNNKVQAAQLARSAQHEVKRTFTLTRLVAEYEEFYQAISSR